MVEVRRDVTRLKPVVPWDPDKVRRADFPDFQMRLLVRSVFLFRVSRECAALLPFNLTRLACPAPNSNTRLGLGVTVPIPLRTRLGVDIVCGISNLQYLIPIDQDFRCRHTPMIDGDREMIFFGG